MEPMVDLRPNRELMAFGQVNFRTEQANDMFRRDLPAFFWNVRYNNPSLVKSLLQSGSAEERAKLALEQHLYGEARLQFDTQGRLLAVDCNANSSADSLPLYPQEAQALALQLIAFSPLGDTSGVVLEKSQALKQKKRVDYAFVWKTPTPMVGLKARLEANVQGARIEHWQLHYVPEISVYKSEVGLQMLSRLLAFLLIAIWAGYYFFKKLRADEISLKAGRAAAIMAALSFITVTFTDTTQTFFIQLVNAIISPGFIFLGFVILYGTGESLMRNLGHDRLLSFGAAQHGRWWFRPVGASFWRGPALAFLLLGGVTVLLNRFGPLVHVQCNLQLENEILRHYTATIPSLSVFSETVYYGLFIEISYRLFLVSALSRFIDKQWLIVVLVGLANALWPLPWLEIAPFAFAFFIHFLLGMALALIYLRFDLLTSLLTTLSLPLLFYGFNFLHTGKIINPLHGWTLLALPLLFIFGGQIIRRAGKTVIDTRALQPDYLDRLAEKERMKRELEIARQVQLSFLPRQLPKLPGLDIAALCIPANEVGGDYYDFVKLSDHHLGVLIGDVSGKGVSAAFYMTLTKGIIKSSVQESLSPAQVLIRANQLFYDNVERGIFVSLIYGVFDLEKRLFTSACAGHNPILLRRRQQQHPTFVSPGGLALGLERGEIFARNIHEQTTVLNDGDVYVFYTDGFTEAMNGRQEEFGESRLIAVLSNGSGTSSLDTINNLRNTVQIFTGAAPQHDDMTMVVVRISEDQT
ncbi:MAG: hypothetical protein ALAOOOJD_01849 [bacterium]|nr:hypothetical protein [bacterium]